jgi:hypothetical protein
MEPEAETMEKMAAAEAVTLLQAAVRTQLHSDRELAERGVVAIYQAPLLYMAPEAPEA